jgi:hypothetical protein
LGQPKKQSGTLTSKFTEETLREEVGTIEAELDRRYGSLRDKSGDPIMEWEMRVEHAEFAVQHYRSLLDEWEAEFKDRYGEGSQEYRNLIAENIPIRERLDKDEEDLLNPETVTRALEFYHEIWKKYRGWDYSGEIPKQRKLERQPGIV